MIQVERLTKIFPLAGGRELTAVNDVSFTVQAGEVYGLLGPNGAGKTTTLRMVLGLLQPTAGWASIAGFRSSERPEEVKRRVGLVSAGAGLYQGLTAREMLLFFADLYGVPMEEPRLELDRLARLLGLTEFLEQRCGTLSTGQKQRVNLARALIHRPPVMLLDEPTLGLDVLASQVVTEYIDHLRQRGQGGHHDHPLPQRCRTALHALRPAAQGPARQRGDSGIASGRDRLHLLDGDVSEIVPGRTGVGVR